MTPKLADANGVSEIYELLRYAAAHRQPVAATYDGQPSRLLKKGISMPGSAKFGTRLNVESITYGC
jgi:hypothetical protein